MEVVLFQTLEVLTQQNQALTQQSQTLTQEIQVLAEIAATEETGSGTTLTGTRT